jgi:transcriptional regulator with XRE-family HTH domain
MEANMKPAKPDIIEAIPKTEEGIALARPRTKKARDAAAREFGIRLEQMRKARGLSQLELAERTDLYQSDVSDFERGLRWPETRNMLALSKALRVSLDELVGAKGVKGNGGVEVSRSILRRLKRIEELPKRDRQALLRMVDNTLVAANGRSAS